MHKILTILAAVSVSLVKIPTAKAETLLDMVVASVDGKAITLGDLSKRLSPPRKVSIEEASRDPEIRVALDQAVVEHLIEEEAKSLKIRAHDEEVEQYIKEVAKQNDMTLEAFEKALKDSHQSLATYKKRVKIDILKSRLVSSMIRDGAAVTDTEVDAYLSEHPELTSRESKLKLSQILISVDSPRDGSTRTEKEAKELASEVQDKAASGEDFAELARKFSDGPEAADGGSIGTITEKDLQSDIYDVITSLKSGEVSKPISTPRGFLVFKVDERLKAEDDSSDVRNDIKKVLEKQKMEQKLNSYFTVDLYKSHHVDKKI